MKKDKTKKVPENKSEKSPGKKKDQKGPKTAIAVLLMNGEYMRSHFHHHNLFRVLKLKTKYKCRYQVNYPPWPKNTRN